MIQVTKITSKGALHFKGPVDYDKCWIYTGPAYWDPDYPIIRRLWKNWIASRFVWYIITGRDYFTKEIHHRCENKSCVNPLHLIELSKTKHRKWHSRKRRVA